MFSKVFSIVTVALAFSAQVHAHATLAPVLGVAGTPKRADAQRPSAANPCGKTNVAATIDTSTPVVAGADGSFTVTATNFNGGRDGSRQVTMTVDATGAGKNFVAGTVTTNGVAAPAAVGSEPITATLPAGTKCTGGKAGNLCLASFTTLGGFGNCVVVQQGAAAAAGAGTAAGTGVAAGAGAAAGAAAGATAAGAGKGTKAAAPAAAGAAAGGATAATVAGTGKAGTKAAAAGTGATATKAQAQAAKAGGSRAPRALRADLEAREEGTFEIVKRGVLSWVWA